ncbi:MAG: hypothetical protein AAF679_02055 [Pseudomonadota bacterium]
MRSYEAARSAFSFAGGMAWTLTTIGLLIIVLGVFAASQATGPMAGLPLVVLAAAPGIIIAGTGYFFQIVIQSSRTSVDCAEYAQQALQVARDQLAINQEMLTLAKANSDVVGYASESMPQNISFDTDVPATTYEAAAQAPVGDQASEEVAIPPAGKSGTEIYLGHQIQRTALGFQVGEDVFPSLKKARSAVDRLASLQPALASKS